MSYVFVALVSFAAGMGFGMWGWFKYGTKLAADGVKFKGLV